MASYDVVGTERGLEVVATENGARIGHISCAVEDGFCDILNIYVSPSFRRLGVASTMMIVLFDHLMTKDDVSEFSAVLPHEDEALEAFLEKMEFERDDSVDDYVSFSVSSVLDNDIVKRMEPADESMTIPLREVRSPGMIKDLNKVLKRMEFISDAKEFYSEFDQDCSMVAVKNGSPVGYSAVRSVSGKKVMLSFIYMDPGHRPAAMQLVKATASAVAEKYGTDCMVSTLPAFDEGKRLLEKLIPEKDRTIEPMIGYRFIVFDEEEGY